MLLLKVINNEELRMYITRYVLSWAKKEFSNIDIEDIKDLYYSVITELLEKEAIDNPTFYCGDKGITQNETSTFKAVLIKELKWKLVKENIKKISIDKYLKSTAPEIGDLEEEVFTSDKKDIIEIVQKSDLISQKSKGIILTYLLEERNFEGTENQKKEFNNKKEKAINELIRYHGSSINITNKRDKVECSIFTKKKVRHDSFFLVQVFCHLKKKGKAIKAVAKSLERDARLNRNQTISIKLYKRDKIKLILRLSNCQIENPQRIIQWKGEFEHIAFQVLTPKKIKKKSLLGSLDIFVNNIYQEQIYFTIPLKKSTPNSDHHFPKLIRSSFPATTLPLTSQSFEKICYEINDKIEALFCFFERNMFEELFNLLIDYFKANKEQQMEVQLLKRRWYSNQEKFKITAINYDDFTWEFNRIAYSVAKNIYILEHDVFSSR